VTVTRTKLASPPEPAPPDPPAERRQHRDQFLVLQYFVGRAEQRRDVAQAAAGTRLPADRVLAALDSLVTCGLVVPVGLRRHPGGWSPTWIRHDPGHGQQQEAQHA
jgi:hypothetical protein